MQKLRFNPSRRGWVLLAAIAVLVSTVTVDAVASVGRIKPGVEVGDLMLGGKRFDEAEKLLTRRAKDLTTTSASFSAKGKKVLISPDQVGFLPDVDTTLAQAKSVGRTHNILVRLWQRVRTYFVATPVPWKTTMDKKMSNVVIADWSKQFDDPGHEAGIRADGTTIVAIKPSAGRVLDRKKIRETLIRGLTSWPRRSLPLPFVVDGRDTDIADAQKAVSDANEMIRASITLTTPSGNLELKPEELAPLLEAVPAKVGNDWQLRVRFSPERTEADLGPRMKPFETEAKNASFSVSGSSVTVKPGVQGLKFDAAKTSDALTEIARADAPRQTEAAFAAKDPDLTAEAAQKLNIHELVSTFTTNHPCCQPRVKNIHAMADEVDGMIVRPGDTFSLNKRVGERTESTGYVSAPMIFDGEFKDSVGGGVSQFATTLYNTVFFGGYDIVSAKAHSYYISRYPPGREATVSWPAPDLKFRNDTSAGILIKTYYSNTSITVSFYGDKGGRSVAAEGGERSNPTQPAEKRTANSAMRPGSERVVSSGSPGFDIVVFRVITKDGKTTRERIFTRYKAEPKQIEYGPGTPVPATPPPAPPTPPPAPASTPGPTPKPSP